MSTWTVPGYTESLELGAGASGRVVLAIHEVTGVPVAVKYLSESLHTRPGFVHDFRAEARLLGGLDSPYVAGLYEYVESPDGAAIVMELVDGVSLRAVLARQGPLDPEAALVILKGSLLGLADAHRAGVVHRDYKPENVLVTPDGASKLVDFGIAVDTRTRAGVAGTPSYMAPEQWRGEPASPATDVYAATATFFECLTGRKPYAGDNIAELALRHVDAPVPAEDVPEAVRPLVRRGLAKEAAGRPGDAEAFVTELEAIAGTAYGPGWEERGRGRLAALVALLPLLLPSARTPGRSTADTARTVLRQPPGRGRAGAWKPTGPGMLAAAAAVLLAVLSALAAPPDSGAAQERAAEAFATTGAGPEVTAGPTVPPPSASPTPGTPGASASGPASASAGGPSETTTEPGPDPGTGPGADPGTDPATGTPAGAPTATGTPSASPADTAPAAPAVKDVTVSEFRQTGPGTATTTVTVLTDGTGPVSIDLRWSVGDTAGGPGTPDGAGQVFRRSGATAYTVTAEHVFQNLGCYWTVTATTTPASADGGASQQLLTRRCDLR
ncbi:serine/threonine protein kinase [Streptomyces toyocaensis]|uniref:Serine/threonine protein kinase n=1 Tax=Streptomyces toyocaensis TaxID=55952 RepID=A0A081XZ73_STRTO|nr:serine/threonine-protein kinase [Streptomyces toyocaensis]KES08846.1 serine/threonine protein kinase [Streptomyces toyocaensis]